ncbi:MAG: hypothetical protein GKS00_28750 [Alphaproteobacteria bacterium]|nr:hypothetical protein [Alphaproteobacteria bacterium]
MATNGKQPMNYERYILPHQLPEVRPRETHDDPLRVDPDEQFFIRTHQAFEIWFAQILSELEYARLLLSQPYVPESDVPVIEGHVRRAAAILDLINQHLPLLETLDTTSFYNFRKHLFGASGTQSFRFREVEWLMGLLDGGLLDYGKRKRTLDETLMKRAAKAKRAKTSGPTPSQREYDSLAQYQAQWNERWDPKRERLDSRGFKGMDATRDALQRRLIDIRKNGTLREKAIEWLERTTFPAPRSARPNARYGDDFAERYRQAYMAAYIADSSVLRDLQGVSPAEIKRMGREAGQKVGFFLGAPHRRAIVFLVQFASQPLLAWPASLVEALLELDQAFANWRDRHIAMVARVLGGGRISTLGSADSGLLYLRETLRKRAFPEIWDARSFMLSREEAASIYTPRQLRAFGFVHENHSPG